MSPQPVPDGFHTVTPYLIVDDVPALLDFAQKAFDAEVIEKLTLPDGTVMHAQIRIGDSMLMMGGARPEWPAMPASLYLYVPDCDVLYRRAIEAGATSIEEPSDQFYGDRHAGVRDSNGIVWWVATHIEDVSSEEIARRAAAMGGGPGEG